MFSGKGQINMDSNLGREIFEICKDERYINIFETGTWNGEGSTICVMNAIINKKDSVLYSLEADKSQFNKATEFWSGKSTKNKLNLINGVLHTKIADKQHVRQSAETNMLWLECPDEWHKWYDGEKVLLDQTKVIYLSNIKEIDIIILDGGEFSTEEDFNVLFKKNPRVIILDDCVVYKCREIRQRLLDDINWDLYKEDLNDRHGWSIFMCVC
jgi:hypothetical protein